MSDVSKSPAVSCPGTGLPGPEPVYWGLSVLAWARIGILTILFAATFWDSLVRLWHMTNPISGDPNWQHSFFVPLIGLYYLYLNRRALLEAPVQPLLWGRFMRMGRLGVGAAIIAGATLLWIVFHSHTLIALAAQGAVFYGILVILLDWGLGTTLWGLLMYAYGIWPGQNAFVMNFAMVVTLFGVVTLVCGWGIMKTAWFPILFLICALPWPPLVYSWVALPLQKLAASAAVGTLRITGVEAWREGTRLYIGSGLSPRVLNVAEACAGLKSLMTFVTVAAAMAFLSNRTLGQRLVITFSAVPIAIFCNMMRVAGQGLLDHYVDQRLSESFAHQFVGLVMLIPAVFLIQLVAWILDNLFIEDADRRGAHKSQPAPAAARGMVIEVPRPSAKPAGGGQRAVASPAQSEDLAAATQRLMAATALRQRGTKGAGPAHHSGHQPQEGQ